MAEQIKSRQLLIDTVEALGYPVYLQGSLPEDGQWPRSFFTHWIFDAVDTLHYSGAPHCCDFGYWLYFYSADRTLVDTVPITAKRALQAKGFVFDGHPLDVSSGRPSHTGVMLTAHYKERIDET